MPSDLLSFFMEVSNEGYEIESYHCEKNSGETVCELHEGIVTSDDIWEYSKFDLISTESKEKKEVKVSFVSDMWNPAIRFSFDNQGDTVNLDVSSKNCKVTDEGYLCIKEDSQGHQFKIVIKKIKS